MTSPFITVLHTTSTTGPNWTYTSAPPSQAHTAPSTLGPRLPRASRNTQQSTTSSAASESKLTRYLLDLERDNFKDVQIPVPGSAAKKKEVLGRAQKGRKPTANVRRVLASQKTFANYLADEEALGQGGKILGIGNTATTGTGTQAAGATTTTLAVAKARRGSTVSMISVPESEFDDRATEEVEDLDGDAMDVDNRSSSLTTSLVSRRKSSAAVLPRLSLVDADGGPPLGYVKGLTGPSEKPRCYFCEICGYWGNYKCLRCGARYCCLECGGMHQETRCLKFYG